METLTHERVIKHIEDMHSLGQLNWKEMFAFTDQPTNDRAKATHQRMLDDYGVASMEVERLSKLLCVDRAVIVVDGLEYAITAADIEGMYEGLAILMWVVLSGNRKIILWRRTPERMLELGSRFTNYEDHQKFMADKRNWYYAGQDID